MQPSIPAARRLLFHGSPRRDLLELQPSEHRELHASDDIRLAVSFLARPEECCCIRTSTGVFVWIAEKKEAFLRRDRGGSIYVVDGTEFSPVPIKHCEQPPWEFTTSRKVTPLMKIDYASARAALLAHGVHVRFVSLKAYRRMDADNSWLKSLSVRQTKREFASGILPVCLQTQRICLAWRSKHVHDGECWGTIGGSAPTTQSLRDSAVRELREEIGYQGEIELYPTHTFFREGFQYHNFVGVVPQEFGLCPHPENRWETVKIAWRDLREWREMMNKTPASFHKGAIEVFRHSSNLINRLIKN